MSLLCSIKIDHMKAFNSISWPLLINLPVVLEFLEQFIAWMKGRIRSPWFSISIIDSLVGYFKR